MNVLLLTLGFVRDINGSDINSALMREFAKHGHEVYIISPNEYKKEGIIECEVHGKIHLHYARIGNYFNTSLIEKGITTILLTKQYIKTIKEELSDVEIDLVLQATPPVTFAGVVKHIKKQYRTTSFLLLKDVWPQTLSDMGALKESSLIYKYFKFKELQMYKNSDYIGCMSPACVKYLLDHNKYINSDIVSICPNAFNFDDTWNSVSLTEQEKHGIREQYGIPLDRVVFVFGGNIGIGHDPDFLEDCICLNEKRSDTFILFVGKGFYYERIRTASEHKNNTKIIPYLPQDKYLKLMASCDVGLITLDHRFTCPNYPSRLLSYLVDYKPVLIAQDAVSDVGPIAEEHGYGYWCESTDPEKFISLMDQFIDTDKRREMGLKGYKFLRENYNTANVYKTIIQQINGSDNK